MPQRGCLSGWQQRICAQCESARKSSILLVCIGSQPGVRGAPQAKHWKAASPGLIFSCFLCVEIDSSLSLKRCAVGDSWDARGLVCGAKRGLYLFLLRDPRELDPRSLVKRTDFELPRKASLHSASKRHSSLSWHRRERAKRASEEKLAGGRSSQAYGAASRLSLHV